MGKSSNFATVPARLIVDEKDHGIQMFIVQLRDLQTHQPLPGKVLFILIIVWLVSKLCYNNWSLDSMQTLFASR